MIIRSGTGNDVVLVSAEYYDDHPLSPVGIIARVLDANGYKVGIIEKPMNEVDITRLGTPRLFFGITSGSMDSMVHNYTPLKRRRENDKYNRIDNIPDRAVIVYCNLIKRYFKRIPIIIGGVEASLRRFAHYDYWDNRLRRSILFDSRADILVYGNGEKQVAEIASRLSDGRGLDGIEGTCVIRKEAGSAERIPSFRAVSEDPKRFCEMTARVTNGKDLAQEYDNNYVIQFRYPTYTPDDLDRTYSLGFSRTLHPESPLRMAQFSIVSHRGCIGRCNFCALRLLQGDKIISRSRKSIMTEIESFVSHQDFKGNIDDVGGPSANMYGMDCDVDCPNDCMKCSKLDISHKRLIRLLREARDIPGIRKIFVRSGIRYDLAVKSREYVKEMVNHHISGTLKIAPEHFSKEVLALMGKDNSSFDDFVEMFKELSEARNNLSDIT